jgi:imidazolonepropionase-like amidohydrolase
MLDHGVTTVRDVCTEGAGYADVALRQAQADGLCDGPRVFPSGPGIGVTGGYYPMGWAPGLCLPMGCAIVDGPEAARREVRAQIAHGVAWIKVFADWSGAEPVTGAGFVAPTFTRDELAAIVDEAARHHRRVAAHVMSDAGARQAIDCGVASLEHMGDFSRETLDLAAARGVALVPTLSVFHHRLGTTAGPKQERFARRWRRAAETFVQARAAGARIVAGSDIGAYPHADGSLSELGLYMELGMSPMEALRTATSAAATLLGVPDAGTIAPGMAADLCAFAYAGDAAAALVRRPKLVVQAGRIVRAAPS